MNRQRVRTVSGGGRAVEVEPERLDGWYARFAERHGGVRCTEIEPDTVVVHAEDGARAEVTVPFGPLPGLVGRQEGLVVRPLVDHLSRPRRIGLVLVRLGGHSVGIAEGTRLVTSSTDRHPVHGRHKAGGWSQQRFARRREGQARQALRAAADAVARVLLPVAEGLDAVVLGGDRSALATLGEDRRLAGLLARAEPRVLDVAEPRLAVLREAVRRARAVEVVVFEP